MRKKKVDNVGIFWSELFLTLVYIELRNPLRNNYLCVLDCE